jgi:hypothetical protein
MFRKGTVLLWEKVGFPEFIHSNIEMTTVDKTDTFFQVEKTVSKSTSDSPTTRIYPQVLTLHEDIIKDDFWERWPNLLC